MPVMDGETVIAANDDLSLFTQQGTERALKFIEKNRSRPFFLYFPQITPGSTQKPPVSPEFRGKSGHGEWSAKAKRQRAKMSGMNGTQLRPLVAGKSVRIWLLESPSYKGLIRSSDCCEKASPAILKVISLTSGKNERHPRLTECHSCLAFWLATSPHAGTSNSHTWALGTRPPWGNSPLTVPSTRGLAASLYGLAT